MDCNAYARQHGPCPFSIYLGRFSPQLRDMERDVIPMCKHEGMTIHEFGVRGAGADPSSLRMLQAEAAATLVGICLSAGWSNCPLSGKRSRSSLACPSLVLPWRMPCTRSASTRISSYLERCGRRHTKLVWFRHRICSLSSVVVRSSTSWRRLRRWAWSSVSLEDVVEIEKGYGFDIG